MKKYFLPSVHSQPLTFIKVRLQGTGSQVAFASCAESNTGCPILRLDFGDLAAPPENYQLELTCSAGPDALSTIPVSTCTVTHVSGQIYDVNCCVQSPCCPCHGDPILPEAANKDGFEIDACCPCGPGDEIPTGLNGCSETTIVRVLDGSGDALSSVITPEDCPSLQQN